MWSRTQNMQRTTPRYTDSRLAKKIQLQILNLLQGNASWKINSDEPSKSQN